MCDASVYVHIKMIALLSTIFLSQLSKVDFENENFCHKQLLFRKISFPTELALWTYDMMPSEYKIRFNDIKYHPYICMSPICRPMLDPIYSH